MIKKILFSVLFTISLLFLVEGGIFLLYRFPTGNPIRYEAAKRFHMTRDSNALQYQKGTSVYDAELSYMFVPGEHRFENREFSTALSINSAGLRDDEASLEAPEIICLGDSFTLGWGVEGDESFPQRLEKLSGMRVLNAGVSSFGTPREFRLLKELDYSGLRYLVIQYCANDLKENMDYMGRGNILNIMSAERYEDLVGQNALVGKFKWFRYMRTFLPELKRSYVVHEERMSRPAATEQEIWTDHLRKVNHFLNAFKGLEVDLKGIPIYVVELSRLTDSVGTFIHVLNSKIESGHLPSYMDGLELHGVDIYDQVTSEDFFVLDGHILPSGCDKVARKLWDTMNEAE